jgi:cytosine/adenosine deaminase-related metal-dependent hydrolase
MAKAYDVPYTIHLSEMDYEINYFRENYNMTPVEYLHQIGFMSENLVAAHCILVNEKDLQIMKEAKVAVAHCIGANTKSAKGVAPLKQMLEWGILVGLGTDGPSSGNTIDVLTQFKLCANFHKNENKDRSAFSARAIVELGTLAGAKALHREAQIGSLEVGKQADLVLVETSSVNMFPLYDPYSALVYSANSSNVAHVFVNGKWVVKDKKLVHEPLAMIRQRLSDLLKNKENGLFSKYLLSH